MALLLLGTCGAACQWIVNIESNAPFDAGTVAAPDGGAAPPRPSACGDPRELVLPPGAASGGSEDIVLAVAHIALGAEDGGASHAGLELCPGVPGVDLDRKTTCFFDGGYRGLNECAEADAVACAWGPSCAAKEPACDPEPDGRDNAVAVMFERVLAALPLQGRPDPQRLLTTGAANWLLRVSGYNGEADDTEVVVAMFRSSGLVRNSGRPRDRDADADGEAVVEDVWDLRSRREWSIDPSGFSVGSTLPSTGRVVNHVLYVTAHDLPAPGLDVILDDVIVTGELRRTTDGFWALARGRFAGRASPKSLLSAIGRLPTVEAPHQRVCDVFPVDSILERACSFRDLGVPQGGSCTDFSFAMGFAAVPAILGPRRASTISRPECEGIPESCPQ